MKARQLARCRVIGHGNLVPANLRAAGIKSWLVSCTRSDPDLNCRLQGNALFEAEGVVSGQFTTWRFLVDPESLLGAWSRDRVLFSITYPEQYNYCALRYRSKKS